MKFKILFFSTLFISSFGFAQYRWDFGGQLGAANYLGDIGGKDKTRRDFVSDMKLGETRWAGAAFLRYKFSPKLSLKGQFAYQRIQGADSLSTNPARRARNLSFRNDIFELSATPQLTIYENQDLGSSYRFKMAFNFYIFAGVGVMHHNPQAKYNGEWINLQPLHTEGVTYSLWQFVVPVGTGFYFTIRKKHRIGFEYNWRICPLKGGDYLDDVSGKYVDPKTLSPMGAILANRTNELTQKDIKSIGEPLGWYNNFLPGSKRGDPKHNDTYMTVSLNYSYVIRGHGSFYRSRYGSFFSKKKKKNSRKVRAKF
ncbi:MAG: DUF6089 family protein [Bacteroidia bacterium]